MLEHGGLGLRVGEGGVGFARKDFRVSRDYCFGVSCDGFWGVFLRFGLGTR